MEIKCIVSLRSSRVVQDQLEGSDQEAVGGGCCWDNLPEDLLWEILSKIENSESSWPQRQNVVACAGVCRSWSLIVKEIVKVPEISGKLTFPISVKQPGPKDCLLQCFIIRDRSTQTYYLYLDLTNELTDGGKFLLAARKRERPTSFSDYIICLQAEDLSTRSSSYVGKLRSKPLGTEFTVFDGQPHAAGVKMTKSHSSMLANSKQVSPRVDFGKHPIARISYESSVLGSMGPRIMQCSMDAIPATSIGPGGVGPTKSEFSVNNADLLRSTPIRHSKSASKDGALVLRNKSPRWHEQLQCWCLNFHGRVTVASVKNFQLVASPENGPAEPENEKIILQFGKVGKDLFTMDYGYPISAFQAFAICLSSFETRISCE